MPESSPGTPFDWVLSPIDPAAFFAEYFEEKILLIKRQAPDYYRDLLSLDDIDHVITDTGLKHPDIGMVNAEDEIKVSDYAFGDGVIDPSRVFQKFYSGSTIILQQLHTRLPKLGAYCRGLEAVFSARTQTNIYLTPGGKQGFKPHYDSHDVFILQISGCKNWRIYENTMELPLRGQTFSPDDFEPGETSRSFCLEPGDMLYVPRGIAHAAVSDSEVSLHVTTGILVDTWTDLILDAVSALALEEPAFRRSIPPGFARAEFDRANARAQFRDLLSTLSQRGDLDAALDRFASEFVSKRHPLLPGQMDQIRRLPSVDIDSEVGARPSLIYRLNMQPAGADGCSKSADGDEGTIVVECYGKQVELPAHAHEAVRFALSSDRYRVRDVPGDLDEDGKIVLIRRLIREGMVMMRG